jgi:predicted ATPase
MPMIKAISISGFQSFKLPQSVRIAPLTLVFGPNSSGKTALLRALRFLDQSWDNNGRFRFNGPAVELGGFSSTVFGTDEQAEIVLGFELDTSLFPKDYLRYLTRTWLRSSRNVPQDNVWIQPISGFALFRIDSRGEGFPRSVELKLDFVLASPEIDAETADVHSLEVHFLRNTRRDSFAWKPKKFNFSSLDSFLAAIFPGSPKNGPGWIGMLQELDFTVRRGMIPSSLATGRGTGLTAQTEEAEFARSFGQSFFRYLSELFKVPGTSNVGPVRAISETSINAQLRSRNKPQERLNPDGSNLVDYFASLPEEAVERVRNWMFTMTDERFSFGTLGVQGASQLDTDEHFKYAFEEVLQLFFFDHHNKTAVLPKNTGSGLTQVLPVIASLVGTISDRGGEAAVGSRARPTIAAIEQPELHLHPAMQAELVNVLVASIQLYRSERTRFPLTVIAETHSESMLLRLQKLVREKKISPNDVSIIYVDQFHAPEAGTGTEQRWGSVAQEIRIASDGVFRDPWPLSFSDVRWSEVGD